MFPHLSWHIWFPLTTSGLQMIFFFCSFNSYSEMFLSHDHKRTRRAKENISFTSSMKSNTLIICSNLALFLFYINSNGVIILEIKETEWKHISKGKINQWKFSVKIQEIKINNFLESEIPSLIQYVYRHIQRAILILSFKKGINAIVELILSIIGLQQDVRLTVLYNGIVWQRVSALKIVP